jgi:hypothetical protein
MNYNSAEIFVGGGNQDKLNWIKNLAFGDGTGASGIWNIQAKKLANYYSSRQASLNPGVTGDGSMF